MNFARNVIQGAAGGVLGGSSLGLIEAVYHLTTSGAPDMLGPFYAVVLYGLLGLPFGIGAGVALTVLEKFKPMGDNGESWAFTVGMIAGWAPMALFILRYVANKEVYLEQGVPMKGNLLILGAVGAVALFDLVVFPKLLSGPLAVLRQAKGVGGLLVVMGLATFGMHLSGGVADVDWSHGRGTPEALAEKPNVVLIMVDTLRADYLGTYGKEGEISPNIDAYADDAVVFEQGFAHASWTRASGASLLSSRIPSSHNTAVKAARMPDEVVLWSEVLHDNGVTTGALVNNINLTATFNFDQGYDTFIYEAPAYPFGATEGVFALTMYKVVHKLNEKIGGKIGIPKAVDTFYQPAVKVLADARAFMTGNKDSRWALFVHLMEPHDPYFEHPNISGDGAAEYNGVGFARAEVEHPDPADAEYLKGVYVDEITFMDKELGAFFDWMKREGVYDNSVIILTADHGEEFFEHGGWWHGTTLYEEQIHVPLIVKLPGNELGGTRVPWQARSIDVAPTIAAALDLEPGEGWQGKDLISDVRADLAEVEHREMTAQIQSESAEITAEITGAEPVEPEVDPCAGYGHPYERMVISEEDFEGNQIASIRTGGLKFIKANEGNPRGLQTIELYDMAADPGETTNLIEKDLPLCDGEAASSKQRRLDKKLGEEIQNAMIGAVASDQAELSDDEIARLQALGYMDVVE